MHPHKSPIVKISSGHKELAISLATIGCTGGQFVDHRDFRLVIRAPRCPWLLKSPFFLKGCWPGSSYRGPKPPPHEFPAAVYEGFETTDDGEIVFRFDDVLFDRPPGRYEGSIETRGGLPLAKIDIDLRDGPAVVDRIRVQRSACS